MKLTDKDFGLLIFTHLTRMGDGFVEQRHSGSNINYPTPRAMSADLKRLVELVNAWAASREEDPVR